jgi:hypothetical protein
LGFRSCLVVWDAQVSANLREITLITKRMPNVLPFVVLNNKNLIISKTCLILSYIDTNKNNTLSNANSFQAFDVLLRKLQKYVPFGASVADLYAGAGAIGLSLAATRKCRHELR